jgi:protein-S-isoprenylcysteine O-methyltransferase Ste14
MKATALKTILFMLLIPGLLVVVFPLWLMATDPALFSFGLFRWLAVPFWAAGAFITIWCAWAFTVRGRGTPSPTDPPKELVVSGLYHYVRNPIYLGVILFLVGHVFWHPSLSILLMPAIVAVCSHLFVILYEEPHLRKTFGAAYEEYCKSVSRWMPWMGKRG